MHTPQRRGPCRTRRGNRNGVVEKANHVAAQRSMSPRWEPDPVYTADVASYTTFTPTWSSSRSTGVAHSPTRYCPATSRSCTGVRGFRRATARVQRRHRPCAPARALPTTWPCPGRSTPSKACPRGRCVNSSPHTSANTHRASISGHRRTSQGPAAAPPVDHQGLHRTAGVNRASADRSFGEQPASRLGRLGLTVGPCRM